MYGAGSLSGSLTGASINATLNESVDDGTFADDLTIYVAGTPLALGGALQCGGYSPLQASQRYWWANGGSHVPGTTVVDTVTFDSAVDLSWGDLSVWIGNGYGYSGTSGVFTGSITLHGVNAVPAPGALAMLAVACAAGRRRRVETA